MARVKVKLAITLQDLEDAIQSAIESASISNTGPDGMSEYEIDSVDVSVDDKGNITADVYCQHMTGKWATADEVGEEVIGSMDSNIQLDIEAVLA